MSNDKRQMPNLKSGFSASPRLPVALSACARRILLKIFIQPIKHRVVPELRILRLQYPVTFIREN